MALGAKNVAVLGAVDDDHAGPTDDIEGSGLDADTRLS